ncbi:MAG: ketoacyl-ACP synthase III [Bacteroidetes bacterium]|nr:ketoacyl-ACP synthase III [Bacteroidota bacterium]
MEKINAAITGVGGYVPEYIMDNEELSKLSDTNDEWITTRIGVKTRHVLKGEEQGTSVMAIKAVEELLFKTNTRPEEVDLLICATVTPDMIFPATANIVSHATGLVNAFSFDLMGACSGFLFALQTGATYIETGKCKKVIIVGADKMTSLLDYDDRTTSPIFGDGAGAVMLEPCSKEYGVQDSILRTSGAGEQYLNIKSSGSRCPVTKETIDKKWNRIYQDGQVVYKAAVSNMTSTTREIMERNNIEVGDLKYLIPHQANKRIIDAVASRLNIPEVKCMVNVTKYGNTTAGTLPLCLWDYEQKLRAGDKVIFTTFGGGFTWGSLYLIWAYNGREMKKRD